MLPVINPAHKRLSLSGILFLRTIFTIQGTHKSVGKIWAEGDKPYQYLSIHLQFRRKFFVRLLYFSCTLVQDSSEVRG